MKVIVFGATGATGSGLIELLSKNQPQWEIFAVSRSGKCDKFSPFKNVTVLKGDANNKDETMALSSDKDLIYSCIGFPKYEAKYWAEHWPVVVDNLLAASSQKDTQKLVFCDNLYAYNPKKPISPSSDLVEPTLKSKLGVRSTIRIKLQDRMNERPNSIAVVGGADFFGDGVTNLSFLGDTFTKAIVSGKGTPLAVGSKTKIHDCCYTKDFSKALYIAGINDKANGKFWICPHSVKNKTLQEVGDDIAKIVSKKSPRIMVLPRWAVWLLSFVDSFMSELIEMLPNWTEDYLVDDSDFCKTFNVEPTPYETALKEYVAFYQNILKEEASS